VGGVTAEHIQFKVFELNLTENQFELTNFGLFSFELKLFQFWLSIASRSQFVGSAIGWTPGIGSGTILRQDHSHVRKA
jgi:hypothetical protein